MAARMDEPRQPIRTIRRSSLRIPKQWYDGNTGFANLTIEQQAEVDARIEAHTKRVAAEEAAICSRLHEARAKVGPTKRYHRKMDGFTGTVTDSRGRVISYVAGKRVPSCVFEARLEAPANGQ